MNSPEGFLPKKLNFTMQAVQVLWFRPLRFECTKVRSLCDDGLCGGLVQQRGPGRGRGGQVGSAADMLAMLDIFQIGEHNTHYKWMFECWILACFQISCGEIL